MNDREYVAKVDALLNQLFPQLGKCVVDVFLLNEVAMETTRRKTGHEDAKASST